MILKPGRRRSKGVCVVTHGRLFWLAGVVLALVLVLAPTASGDDVSTQGWATASDLTISNYVQSPYTPQQWGGDGASAEDLYNLVADGYNASQVQSMEAALEQAGEQVGEDPNPWAVVANVAINVGGTYLAYKARGLWFHWLSSEWGDAVTGQTNGCVAAATDLTSNCTLWRIKAGTQLCIGYKGAAQTAVTWTAPSDGLLLAGNTTNLFTSSFSGPCNGYNSWNPVALPSSNTTAVAAVNASAGPAFETDSGLSYTPGNDFIIWFQKISGTWAGGAHPAGFPNDHIEPYTTQPIPTGDLGRYVGTPTVTQIANAFRQQLTDPSDTCGGSPCPWGNNGGSPGVLQTHHNSWNMSCLISGTCSSTSISATFDMPNCYGMTFDGCNLAIEQLGFTGTLVEGTAGSPDYSIPAGDVISTDPAAGAAESTVASATADAYENPQHCKWQVNDPHLSSGTPGAVDVKATATCNYDTTVTASLTLWKCLEEPSADLSELNNGDWGCAPYSLPPDQTTRSVAADTPAVFQVPPPGGDVISADGEWFVAYGTLDVGDPPGMFSNIVQLTYSG